MTTIIPIASSIYHDFNNLAYPSTGFSKILGFQQGLSSTLLVVSQVHNEMRCQNFSTFMCSFGVFVFINIHTHTMEKEE